MSVFKKLKKAMAAEKEAKEASLAKPTRRGRPKKTKEGRDRWFESEGKLPIDLYKSGDDLVIQSPIAGVTTEDLEIVIQGDIINIKGVRMKPTGEPDKSYFFQECYWGPFSRQIVLPEEVDPSRVQARLKDGILTIRIPRIEKDKKRKITINP